MEEYSEGSLSVESYVDDAIRTQFYREDGRTAFLMKRKSAPWGNTWAVLIHDWNQGAPKWYEKSFGTGTTAAQNARKEIEALGFTELLLNAAYALCTGFWNYPVKIWFNPNIAQISPNEIDGPVRLEKVRELREVCAKHGAVEMLDRAEKALNIMPNWGVE